jgi:hypothetical protein
MGDVERIVHTVTDVAVHVNGHSVIVRDVPAIRTPSRSGPLVSLIVLELVEERLRASGRKQHAANRYATLVK